MLIKYKVQMREVAESGGKWRKVAESGWIRFNTILTRFGWFKFKL
jgi:hypothetical protein